MLGEAFHTKWVAVGTTSVASTAKATLPANRAVRAFMPAPAAARARHGADRACRRGALWRSPAGCERVANSRVQTRRGRRLEERRVGKECVRTCRFRWGPDHSSKK